MFSRIRIVNITQTHSKSHEHIQVPYRYEEDGKLYRHVTDLPSRSYFLFLRDEKSINFQFSAD